MSGRVLAVGSIDGIEVPMDNILLPLTVETLFVGLFTSLIAISSHHLIQRGVRRPANALLLSGTVLMYIFSTTHWILYLSQARCALNQTCTPFRTHAEATAFSALLPLCFVLSDAIVIWRTWLIWERKAFVLIVAAPLLVGTLITAIANVVLLPHNAFLLNTIVQSFAGSWWGFSALCLTLATNVWATALIAYKTWRHHRAVIKVQKMGENTHVERMLTLLVQVGSLYIAVFVLHILGDAGALGLFGIIVSTCTIQVIGLYPTLVVVMFCLNHTQDGADSGAPGPPTITFDVPSTILDIRGDASIRASASLFSVASYPPTSPALAK